MILEGGSVHFDGEGTLLTTAECLLEKNDIGRFRNPGMSKDSISANLTRYLGVEKILWLPQGAADDLDTNGHVDNMCCFLRPGVVALLWAEEDENPEQHRRAQAAVEYLATQTDAQGRKIEVVKILAPRKLLRTAEECEGLRSEDGSAPREVGENLPGSYINFYMPNGAVIVPQFGDTERDLAAVTILTQQFPDRQIVPIMSREILCGGGNIHCITMQHPAEQ